MKQILQRVATLPLMIVAFSSFSGLLAQGPTLIDAVEVVEGSPTDTVMVAEWLVTNASESPMTLYVERNVLQVVDPMNLPYQAGAEGAYERFCWGGTCYPYGTGSSALPLALTLAPMDTTGINSFGAEDWLISDYYPNGVSGVTALEYCFKATQQGVPEVCHTVLFCTGVEEGECVASLGQEQQPGFEPLAPNPIVGRSVLTYFAPEGGNLVVMDLTGKTVKSVPLAPGRGMVWMDASEFAPGVYLHALQQNGRILQAHKFSVSR
ncbi:MAG: hypothetical protein ISP55_07590 [Flavobacteriales bacterium]|nr:hypothetical protein [Flavobacteriales bacterium]